MTPSAVAFVPARSGSERVPGKNVRPLAGHPLLAYAIETALQSGVFDRVVCSTDSEEIADVARWYGAEVPFLRPAALATLHWTHRAWAHVVLVLAAILVVVLASDKRRRAALLLALLVVLQLASGAAAVLGDLPLGIVVAHNLIAAILLATLVAIACRYPASEVQPPVSEV